MIHLDSVWFGRTDGVYPDPSDKSCSIFYNCTNENGIRNSCPVEAKYFRSDIRSCDSSPDKFCQSKYFYQIYHLMISIFFRSFDMRWYYSDTKYVIPHLRKNEIKFQNVNVHYTYLNTFSCGWSMFESNKVSIICILSLINDRIW